MAYTPINWQTGDTITADKLNKMDNGWGVESTQLFSETVTTAVNPDYPEESAIAQLAYSQPIDADTITVTFDGTEYTCPRIPTPSGSGYGAPWSNDLEGYDFSEYPFGLGSVGSNPVVLITQTAGEHTVAVSVPTLQTSADFSEAVKSTIDLSTLPFRCVSGETTYGEMYAAFYTDNRPLYFFAEATCFYITGVATNIISFMPTSAHVAASFSNDVFTVTIS